MSYAEHWEALAARLQALAKAGETYALFQSYQAEDSYGAGNFLREQCHQAVLAIQEFQRTYEGSLPLAAKERIDFFLCSPAASAVKEYQNGSTAARAALVVLAALESEVTFILAGRQEQIRGRTERALILLQRQLVVDEDVQARWAKALAHHETACEALGSVFLLSQGIFAFKVDAAGGRTDLVFPEPIDESRLARAVDGFVLTEWKIATPDNAQRQFAVARKQADLYQGRTLAGVELTGYRYLIAVSDKELPAHAIPDDEVSQQGVIYRHVNIATRPTRPSVLAATSEAARKHGRAT